MAIRPLSNAQHCTGRQAGHAPLPGRASLTACKENGLPHQSADWFAMTDQAAPSGQRTGSQNCHCEERSDVAIRPLSNAQHCTGRQAGHAPLPGRASLTACKENGLPHQSADWFAMTDQAAPSGQRTGSQNCHCEERSDVAIRPLSNDRWGRWYIYRNMGTI